MRTRRITQLAIAIGLLTTVSAACRGPGPIYLTNAPGFEVGLQLFPSPRTFDPPGTVFRIDEGGVRHAVVDLSRMLVVVPRDESIPQLSATGLLRADLLLGWVGVAGVGGGGIERLDTVVVHVLGAKREQAFEVDLQNVVDSARKVIDWRRQGSLYLITETVLGDTVNIAVSSSLAAYLDRREVPDSVRTAGVEFRWRPQRAARISMRFTTPHRIFYKAVRLVRRSGGLEPDSIGPVLMIPVNERISWSRQVEGARN